MTSRAKEWAIMTGFSLAAWGLLWIAISHAAQVAIEISYVPQASEAWMLAHRDDYFPTLENRCHDGFCDLTGPGGHVMVWDLWLDFVMLKGYDLRVVGLCASACEREYQRAVSEFHVIVSMLPGARLVYHDSGSVTP